MVAREKFEMFKLWSLILDKIEEDDDDDDDNKFVIFWFLING